MATLTLNVLLFIVAIGLTSSTLSRTISDGTRDDDHFDYLLLAQFWPPTSCIYFKNQGDDCNITEQVHGWTIHGLWPSRPHSMDPHNCNGTAFDMNIIESLEKVLLTEWPSFNTTAAEDALWEHEWEKHGTCAYSLAPLKGEYNYFNRTLDLHSKLNTFSVLKAANIVPSYDVLYSPQEICDAVAAHYGKIPMVSCIKDKETHNYYLDQIWLCYEKNFGFKDCPDAVHAKEGRNTLYFKGSKSIKEKAGNFDGCPTDGKVYYEPLPN